MFLFSGGSPPRLMDCQRLYYFSSQTSNAIIKIAKMAEIQIGDNTHHHDQAMYLVSFKTIKTMVRRPTNPMPDELELLDFDILIALVKIKIEHHHSDLSDHTALGLST